MLQIYKSLKAHIHFSENGENNFVTWTLEYEKINEDVPDPDALIDLAYKVTKVVELHLLKWSWYWSNDVEDYKKYNYMTIKMGYKLLIMYDFMLMFL